MPAVQAAPEPKPACTHAAHCSQPIQSPILTVVQFPVAPAASCRWHRWLLLQQVPRAVHCSSTAEHLQYKVMVEHFMIRLQPLQGVRRPCYAAATMCMPSCPAPAVGHSLALAASAQQVLVAAVGGRVAAVVVSLDALRLRRHKIDSQQDQGCTSALNIGEHLLKT